MTGKVKRSFTIVHRYFWPQNYPYATMLKDIAETVGGSYQDVLVLSSQHEDQDQERRKSNFDQTQFRFDVLNMEPERHLGILGKALSMARYVFWLGLQLLSSKSDVVMVATTPPIFAAVCVRWVAKIKKFKYIYHCQDIHPEAMSVNGDIKSQWLYRLLKKLDKKNVDAAAKVIVLSEDMKRTLALRGSDVSHVEIINNFIFDYSDAPSSLDSEKVKFLFAGTMGRFQNLEMLVRSLDRVRGRSDVEFHFMGDGAAKSKLESLKAELSLDNVFFHDHRSVEEALDAMNSSHFGIVSLAKGVSKVAYPSKTMMYLGSGLPILALVDRDSEIFSFINENKLGLAVEPDSVESISKAIEELLSVDDSSVYSRDRVKRIANEYFSKKVILEKFSKALVNV